MSQYFHEPNEDSAAATGVGPIKRNKCTRWTEYEHRLFLSGMKIFGKGKWKSIAQHVGTKTPIQVASHAQKYFLRHRSVKQKKRPSILDITIENDLQPVHQHNPEHPIQQFQQEIHKAQEMIGLQNDNLAPHFMETWPHPTEQSAEKLHPQQLTAFEGNLALHHNDQNWPPSTMQQLPHSGQLELLAKYVNQEMIFPLDLQIQKFPQFTDHYNWTPTPNEQLLHDFDQQMTPNNILPDGRLGLDYFPGTF